MPSVAQYLVQQLTAWGVRHVYGVVGDTFFPLMDAIAAQDQLRFIPVRHEAAAGFMASAEAKLTGRLAVCVATSGPGIANLINGLGDAYADRVPVLALTGQVDASKIGTNTKQYVDRQALVRPLSAFTELLAHPDAAGTVLPSALRTAVGERRVAHISVPKDLWSQPCSATVTPPEPFLGAAPVPDPATLEGAGGTDASHAALQEADLLLTVACNWWPQKYVPEHLPVIKVDRQPVAVGGNMPVRYGVPGLAQTVIPHLTHAIPSAERDGWRRRLTEVKQAWQQKLDHEAAPGGPPMTPQHIVRALEQALVSGKWRSLGFGLPAALAAKLCHPERKVVALVGDTGLQSLLGELSTAAALGKAITVVVVNNGRMAIEPNRATMQGHTQLGTAPGNPDFAVVAQGCGMRGMRANSAPELAEALRIALSADGPPLIDAAASAPVAPTSQS